MVYLLHHSYNLLSLFSLTRKLEERQGRGGGNQRKEKDTTQMLLKMDLIEDTSALVECELNLTPSLAFLVARCKQ